MKPGERLRSQVCSTEAIVIRPPAGETVFTCGGQAMVGVGDPVDESLTIAPGMDTGSQLGKRYTSEADASLELLVTKGGTGTLAADGTPLVIKDAKPLPSSD